MTPTTRRRFLLASAVGIGTALAGCSNAPGSSGPSDSPSPTGSGFPSVRTEGTALVVELGEMTLDSVSVVAPDGTTFADEPVQAGVSTVEIPIGTEYEPGEYRVLGVVDGESVAEARIEIRPELEIVEVGVGANHLERMPDELNFREEQALVRVRNLGTGPDALEALSILGMVPNPTDPNSSDDENSGLFDPMDGYGDAESIVVPSGGTVTVYSTTQPFLFSDSGFTCSRTTQTGSVEFVLRTRLSGTELRSVYSIEYSAAESPDGCTPTILEKEA